MKGPWCFTPAQIRAKVETKQEPEELKAKSQECLRHLHPLPLLKEVERELEQEVGQQVRPTLAAGVSALTNLTWYN